MNQVLITLLFLSSTLFVAPIYARQAKSPTATPAPGPSNSDCSTIIYSLMDCLSYLSVPSNDTKPEKACCDGIKSVLEFNPKCICVGLESSKQMGLPLNNTRALAAPKTCNIKIPAPHCGMIASPTSPAASTPTSSPSSPSSGITPTSPSSSTTTSPSSTESPAVSAPAPSRSGSNNLSVPILAVLVSFVAFFSAFSH